MHISRRMKKKIGKGGGEGLPSSVSEFKSGKLEGIVLPLSQLARR